MSETTTNSPEMQEAVDRVLSAMNDRMMATIFGEDAAYDRAYDESMQACLDVAAMIRAGQPAPPEMPENVEQFLAAYPEGATVESIRAEQEAKEN